jgi:transcription antitermination factor NusG
MTGETGWHVLRTRSDREHSVATALQNSDIPAFSPQIVVTQIRHGRRIERRQALFRNYAFAQWDGEDAQAWHRVNDTKDVYSTIGGGNPVEVEPDDIEKWRNLAPDTESAVEKTLADLRRGYKIGSKVRLQKGRDDAMVGFVVWFDDRAQKVGIRVDILGRQPVVVRRQNEIESADAPLPPKGEVSRRRRGGKRGTRARKQAFANYLVSASRATG